MSKPKFADIFTDEFLGYVTRYRRRIQEILNEYEIVIFMARKAVCFYKAMVLNGELIVPSSCKILSSRIKDYNILRKYKDKKIAIIDDVVIKGESLCRVGKKLNEYNIDADVLVVACSYETKNGKMYEIGYYENLRTFNSYVVLDQKDIYSFAGMITEYIEASMCPFNIDQPIYTVNIENSQELQKFLYHNHAIDITSGNQQYYGITNNVIYLTVNYNIPYNSPLFLLKESILKIRILSDGKHTIAVPFVLFPMVTSKQLEELFSLIMTDDIIEFTKVDNERMTQENKMKVISYFLSEILINSSFKDKSIAFKKQDDNDIFLFAINTSELFEGLLHNLYKHNKNLFNSFTSIYVEYNKFEFPALLASCYQSISKIDTMKQNFINSEDETINKEIIITLEMLYDDIKTDNELNNKFDDTYYLTSCAIDIFIDRGMIVPSIVHTKNNGIIRAYKMGEYSKLTRSQIESFAAMLYQYQDLIEDSLSKTELEKLCVLFFKMAIIRKIFLQQESYEDGCYSICYSLYGPRISASAISYKVGTKSALVTNFYNKPNDEKLVNVYKGKYIIQSVAISKQKDLTFSFAYQYFLLRTFFKNIEAENKEIKSKRTSWNITYIQYLTLRAIGDNKKNQFLSLCAELYQVIQLSNMFFESDKNNRQAKAILSGINSGLWKYWCYSNDVLCETTQWIIEKDKNIGALLLFEKEQPSDKKDEWKIAIDKAGKLLYEIAFFINEILKIKGKVDEFSISDWDSKPMYDVTKTRETLFTYKYYYNYDEDIKNLRLLIEKKVMEHSTIHDFNSWYKIELEKLIYAARFQLDVCDVILKDNNPSINYYTKYIIVFSKNGIFPNLNSTNDIAEQELILDGIKNNSTIKIYGLKLDQNALSFVSEIQKKKRNESLYYAIFDLDNPNLEIIIKNEKGGNSIEEGKNSILASKINEIIKKLEKEELNDDVLLISPKLTDLIKHNNIQPIYSLEELKKSNICKILKDIINPFKDNNMQVFIFNNDFNGQIYVAEGNGTIDINSNERKN